jgi:hypothetical protein
MRRIADFIRPSRDFSLGPKGEVPIYVLSPNQAGLNIKLLQ